MLAVGFLALAYLLFAQSYAMFRQAALVEAADRGRLYQSTLTSALERYQYLPAVLAQDPVFIDALSGAPPERANLRLESFASQAQVEAIYLMDRNGLTLAASNHALAQSFVGQSYDFRPYFRAALKGARGEFFAIGATTSVPGYFIAAPVRDATGEILGVIALKVDLSGLERTWAEAGESVFITNPDGVVLLSSDDANRYRTTRPLSAERRAEVAQERQFGAEPLQPLDWTVQDETTVTLGQQRYLHTELDIPLLGWTMHYLSDEWQVRERAWFAMISAAIVVVIVLAGTLYLRARRIHAALRLSQSDRRKLRAVNLRLGQEIEERRTAERQLRNAQTELGRKSRLAALGQLAASVTHELGQPISAMRNYLAAAQIQGGDVTPDTLTRLEGISRRMEAITGQLRFFASPGRTEMEPVDLRNVVAQAMELVAHNVAALKISANVTLPDNPVIVAGSSQRLEQVVVNLLKNAVDALRESPDKCLSVTLEKKQKRAILGIQDSGAGLQGQSLEQILEPFHSTRASGEGMGLGLAISSAIVKEHDGKLGVESIPEGGTLFTLDLPLTADKEPEA